MSRPRVFPVLAAFALATTLAQPTVAAPLVTSGPALSRSIANAPAALDVAFRDLPSSVARGDVLTLKVDAPSGATCEGTLIYRDDQVVNLERQEADNDRCRWFIAVPEDAGKGAADISVHVRDGDHAVDLAASVDVVRQEDSVNVTLRTVPGTIRPGEEYDIRLKVAKGATCQGLITYADDTTQILDGRSEDNGKCSWSVTAPENVERGTAYVRLTITADGMQRGLATSFEVGRRSSDASLMAVFEDLPTTASRGEGIAVKVRAPNDAVCNGSIEYRDGQTQTLEDQSASDDQCRWFVSVPGDARRGDAEVRVTVKTEDEDTSAIGKIAVDKQQDDIEATLHELPSSIKRGEEMTVEVDVPNKTVCEGRVAYKGGESEVQRLDIQNERRDRCKWTIAVPKDVTTGLAVVQVYLTLDGQQTSLVRTIDVTDKNGSLDLSWKDLPDNARQGTSFAVRVDVTNGAACYGMLTLPGGAKVELPRQDERRDQCRWDIDLAQDAPTGQARVEVTAEKGDRAMMLRSSVEIRKK